LADAILDRVVHSSHKIELKGTRSMRDGDAAPAPLNHLLQAIYTGQDRT